jgi:hypothetical protein
MLQKVTVIAGQLDDQARGKRCCAMVA